MVKSLLKSPLVTVFLLFGSLPSLASVTISGITIDCAVVNDNTAQATLADYSCTQSGTRITLSGRQPLAGTNVTYHIINLHLVLKELALHRMVDNYF